LTDFKFDPRKTKMPQEGGGSMARIRKLAAGAATSAYESATNAVRPRRLRKEDISGSSVSEQHEVD
jgi:hypothetical protein